MTTSAEVDWKRSDRNSGLLYLRDKRERLVGDSADHVDDIELTAEIGAAEQLISLLEQQNGKLTVRKDTVEDCGVEHARRPNGTVVMTNARHCSRRRTDDHRRVGTNTKTRRGTTCLFTSSRLNNKINNWGWLVLLLEKDIFEGDHRHGRDDGSAEVPDRDRDSICEFQ